MARPTRAYTRALLWLGLAAYYLAVVLLHDVAQRLLLSLIHRWSFIGFEVRVFWACAALALPALVLVTLGAWRRGGGRWLALWFGLVLCVAAVDRWFLFSQSERIHYPQYALVSLLLRHLLGRPWRALLASSALGVGDELYQALVLYRHRAESLDLKDMALNVLGSAMGLVVHRALHRGGPPGEPPAAVPGRAKCARREA